MPPPKLIYRVHAIQRMFERGITAAAVEQAIVAGETVREYPDDIPFPSRLILGRYRDRPLHVVVAEDEATGETIVITVYEPSPAQWQSDFRRRKR